MPRQKHYHGENHLHFLTTSIYPYNAEGRVTHSSSSGQWQYPTYNALGQRVEDYQGTASTSMKLYYPRDILVTAREYGTTIPAWAGSAGTCTGRRWRGSG